MAKPKRQLALDGFESEEELPESPVDKKSRSPNESETKQAASLQGRTVFIVDSHSLIFQVFQIMTTLVTTLATMTTMVTTNWSPMRKKRKKFNMTSTFSTLVVRW